MPQLSPSKINLHLRVGAAREDGFHLLRSWMVTTSLCDTIRYERVEASRLALACDDPAIPTDERNLVLRAAKALLDRLGPSPRFGFEIHLAKRIPAGAGLGGGSGDAATTLRALNLLLDRPLSDCDISELAKTLGSDVPFFLGSPSAIATGRGEELQPTSPPRARWALLILPPYPIPTARAYQLLDQLRPQPDPSTLDPFDAPAWASLGARDLMAHLVNDLEPAAFAIEPRLAVLHSQVSACLERTVRMSGSGSTLFTLFDTPAERDAAGIAISNSLRVRVEPVELGITPRAAEPSTWKAE